jgi:hypothetical protein
MVLLGFVCIFQVWSCGAWNSCILSFDSRLVRLLCGASYFRDIVLIIIIKNIILQINVTHWVVVGGLNQFTVLPS